MVCVMYLYFHQVDKDETKRGRNRNGEWIKFLPLSKCVDCLSKISACSSPFFELQLKTIDTSDAVKTTFCVRLNHSHSRHVSSINVQSISTVCNRLPEIENLIEKRIKINFPHSIFLRFWVENLKINSTSYSIRVDAFSRRSNKFIMLPYYSYYNNIMCVLENVLVIRSTCFFSSIWLNDLLCVETYLDACYRNWGIVIELP